MDDTLIFDSTSSKRITRFLFMWRKRIPLMEMAILFPGKIQMIVASFNLTPVVIISASSNLWIEDSSMN
jgi:hypothetical protein